MERNNTNKKGYHIQTNSTSEKTRFVETSAFFDDWVGGKRKRKALFYSEPPSTAEKREMPAERADYGYSLPSSGLINRGRPSKTNLGGTLVGRNRRPFPNLCTFSSAAKMRPTRRATCCDGKECLVEATQESGPSSGSAEERARFTGGQKRTRRAGKN